MLMLGLPAIFILVQSLFEISHVSRILVSTELIYSLLQQLDDPARLALDKLYKARELLRGGHVELNHRSHARAKRVVSVFQTTTTTAALRCQACDDNIPHIDSM